MNQWRKNMIVLGVSFFMINMTHSMVMPFLPLFMKTELGVADPARITLWAGFIFAASYITMVLFGPLWGTLGDRYGNKSMIIKSGLWITLIMALMAFAQTPWQLFLLRLLNGALSGFVPAGNAMAAANTPPEKVGTALGGIMAGSMAGNVLGPVIGGAFIHFLPFRGSFLFAAGLRLLATVLIWYLAAEGVKSQPAKERGGIAVGFKTALTIKPLPTVFLLAMITQFALMGTNAFLPIFVEKFAPDAINVAFYITLAASVTGVSAVIASPLFGWLSDRVGAEKMIAVCLLTAGGALMLQSLAADFMLLLGLRFLFGFATGGVLPSFNSLINVHAPPEMKGRFFAYNNSFFQAGMMLGPILGGFFANAWGIESLFFSCGTLLTASFVWVILSICQNGPKRSLSEHEK